MSHVTYSPDTSPSTSTRATATTLHSSPHMTISSRADAIASLLRQKAAEEFFAPPHEKSTRF
eukprot:scaffold54537_cov27-Tisochrysis_lutea.AAC.5